MPNGPPDSDEARDPDVQPGAPVSAAVPAIAVHDDGDEAVEIPDASSDILSERPVTGSASPPLNDQDEVAVGAPAPSSDDDTPAGADARIDPSDEVDVVLLEEPEPADASAPGEPAPGEPEPDAAAATGPLGTTLDTITDGLLLDYETPTRRPAPVSADESGAALPSFDAPSLGVLADPSADLLQPDLAAFPGSEAVPFPAPAPRPARPSRVRPEVRIPRKADLEVRPRPEPSEAAIGIDLGTTNCCAAVVRDGRAFVVATRVGTSTMPSAVTFTSDGDVVVGRDALRGAASDPAHTITGSKRLVGRSFHSPVVQSIRSHFAYAIVEGDEGEAAVDIGDGDIVSLEEVSAYMLREVRESASLLLGEPVTRAVITCPAFYNERQREAVRVAGELAGFIVERVLSEPTAAALNHGYGRDLTTRRVAVYDLGGGTFDVSILEVDGTVYEVLATGGDTFLGGIDFDATIAELAVERILAEGRPDPRGDPTAIARLMDAAEQAKKNLTDRPATIFHVSELVVGGGLPFDVTLPLQRSEVDARIEPLLARTAEIVEDVCSRAELSPGAVDDVLLVGGMTRYPAVADRVARIFGRPPRSHVNPDEAVALGAAQYAAGLNTVDSVVLIDALPMSVGVGLPGGRFLPVLSRDQRLPAQGSCLLPTARRNQRSMDVWFFQGEGPTIAETEPLGRLEIEGLPPGPIGAVTVLVEAKVNEESVLEVRARDQAGGRIFSSRFATRSTPEALRARLGLPAAPSQLPAVGGPTRVWSWLTSLFGR